LERSSWPSSKSSDCSDSGGPWPPGQMTMLELPLDWEDDSAAELEWLENKAGEQLGASIHSDSVVVEEQHREAAAAVAATTSSATLLPRLSSQSSANPNGPPRPPGMDQDALLRLLAEAYGQMMLGRSGKRSGQEGGVQEASCTPEEEEELDGWLRQLRELAQSGDSDTVLALYSALKARHAWARLGDVYSALVHLRERH
jgi:hypothetical protein